MGQYKYTYDVKKWFRLNARNSGIDDLDCLALAIHSNLGVHPYECFRNDYNGKLVIRHVDSNLKLSLSSRKQDEFLLTLIRKRKKGS